VGISIILAGAVMPALVNGFVWRESFQPGLVIVVEAAFAKIDQIYTK